ncbi:MAG: class I adenylate-forming enzyme family protein [Acidimicrobiales bacterium]
MKVQLNVRDYLDRAVTVYGDRVGVIDEPDQPAPPLGPLTYRQLGEYAAAMAAGLDELGVGPDERVAIVSHNSARLLVSFFGVSGWGRVLVPINFRLQPPEIEYIVEHSGASVLLIDPELADDLAHVKAPHTYVLGEESDAALFRFGVEPRPWESDEDATATINYTSGTTARPKGVEQTHRSLWLNAAMFGWHAGVSDRDTYLHTPRCSTATGGATCTRRPAWACRRSFCGRSTAPRSSRRIDHHGVTYLCRAPAVGAMILDAGHNGRSRRGDLRPRPGTHGHGRRTATHPDHRAGGDRARLGVHPDLRAHRDLAAPDHEPQPPSGTSSRRSSAPRSCRAPGHR